jgi:hypothetical protein
LPVEVETVDVLPPPTFVLPPSPIVSSNALGVAEQLGQSASAAIIRETGVAIRQRRVIDTVIGGLSRKRAMISFQCAASIELFRSSTTPACRADGG